MCSRTRIIAALFGPSQIFVEIQSKMLWRSTGFARNTATLVERGFGSFDGKRVSLHHEFNQSPDKSLPGNENQVSDYGVNQEVGHSNTQCRFTSSWSSAGYNLRYNPSERFSLCTRRRRTGRQPFIIFASKAAFSSSW
jgi:hypothetical protein